MYAKFLANSHVGSTLLLHKHYFLPVELLSVTFFINPTKEMGNDF